MDEFIANIRHIGEARIDLFDRLSVYYVYQIFSGDKAIYVGCTKRIIPRLRGIYKKNS